MKLNYVTFQKKIVKNVRADNYQKLNSYFKPQPYRIIIKLSGANPSAPAESVTKALRKAGIQFEVEKIERFSSDSDSQALPLKR